MKKNKLYIIGLALLVSLYSCAPNAKQLKADATDKIYTHVEWSKNANIYEVNIRQYTHEGSFKAFEKHMPRLKQMGVKILWIMPIHPISKTNRKGTMGSYYAVQDYQKVNPDFGTLNDFKHMVNYAHELNMKVIIDWVANHTGWDNWLITEHSDWYTKDSLGNKIVPANTDWTDVADLNYDMPDLREYMIQSLEYWVKEADIDGYRCDVAGMVPADFWVNVRIHLDAIKPVFMLAEWESKDILQAFDMVYGWELHHIMNEIAQGKKVIDDLDAYFAKIDTIYSPDDYYMNFTSNHDENSWNGTVFDRMGKAAEVMAVLSATVPGMPLIYSGQENKLTKKLEFFEKDTIGWGNFGYTSFYTKLLHLKKENKALWNGAYGGSFSKIDNTKPEVVYSFIRKKGDDKIIVVLNFSDIKQTISLAGNNIKGNYISLFNQANVVINNGSSIKLSPWGYVIFVKK